MRDVVIIGAGIAGLAAAWELQRRGLRPLVLEQSMRPGGVIVTERTDAFVIDGGPDSLLTQKPAALELCGELGIRDRLIPTLPPRTAFVLRRGTLVPLPEASVLGLPTRFAPFLRSQLLSWIGKARMASEALRPRDPHGDESIAQFIQRRFGREAVDYLAEPLLAGIHAGNVEQLSMQALFPRLVDLESCHGSVLRGLRTTRGNHTSGQAAFVSFPNGLAELPETLAGSLERDTVRYGMPVAQISGGPLFKLTLASDAAVHARAVIVATPAWSAARVLRSLDAKLAKLCDEIPYASTATIVFAFRRDQIGHPLQGTGFVVPRVERKTLLAATWITSKWAGRAPMDHVLIRGFVGGATDFSAAGKSQVELTRLALSELRPLLRIAGDPVLIRVFRWLRATPQYVVGHASRVQEIDAHLSSLPGLFLTGSGYRGTGIPDCVADARRTAERAATFLTAPATSLV